MYQITEVNSEIATYTLVDSLEVKQSALNYFDASIIPAFNVKTNASPTEADAEMVHVRSQEG